jgi:outer membrane protein assembly factor BamE (lipoprotein component of BamABCDE complex)
VAPPATPSVDVKLGETNAEASALESPALKTAVKPAASVAPAELMGKTQDQIKAMLGTPRTVVDFGSKGIYVFEGRRITFTQGKVTDVQ